MNASLLRWISDEEPAITLICGSAIRTYNKSTTPLRVEGCIADTPLALAPQILACGAEALSVDVDACECENRERARKRFEVWQSLLGPRISEYQGKSPRFRPAQEVLANSAPVSRRALFGLSSDSSLPVDISGNESAQLSAALAILGIEPEIADEFATAPSAARLKVSGCTACGVCVSACPTHALALENANEKGSSTAILMHDRTICEGSAKCIELCPEDAISRGATLSLAEMKRVEVARLQTAKCRKCQSLFEDDGEDLCPTCRRVEQDPFGCWLPPGFERK